MARNYTVYSIMCKVMNHENPVIKNMNVHEYYTLLCQELYLPPLEALANLDTYREWADDYIRSHNIQAYVQINTKRSDSRSYQIIEQRGDYSTNLYLEDKKLIQVETRFQEVAPTKGNDILLKLMEQEYTHHNIHLRLHEKMEDIIWNRQMDQFLYEAKKDRRWYDN